MSVVSASLSLFCLDCETRTPHVPAVAETARCVACGRLRPRF